MNRTILILSLITTIVFCPFAHGSSAQIYGLEYPPSTEPNGLAFGVTYRLWLPAKTDRIRGVIVHQHGCGVGACRGGFTAAEDLHWQALAEKWDCALLGPSYHQPAWGDCQDWCDPRNGSNETFLRALRDFASLTGHQELTEVPWCLWGHSGGGLWASVMQTLHPERIVAIWLRSGTAYPRWEHSDYPRLDIPPTAYQVPVICNPGVKERDHERFGRLWRDLMRMVQDYRAQGAPIAFAPDPRTNHECGDSRYLAIPFFDACLDLRLPTDPGSKLRPISFDKAWSSPILGKSIRPLAEQENTLEVNWLPNSKIAQAWQEYVRSGAVTDTTPPPAPHQVQLRLTDDASLQLDWQCRADLESGLAGFEIAAGDQIIAQLPKEPVGRFGRPLFQPMSYHDTPEAPVPALHWEGTLPAGVRPSDLKIRAINSNQLPSAWTPVPNPTNAQP